MSCEALEQLSEVSVQSHRTTHEIQRASRSARQYDPRAATSANRQGRDRLQTSTFSSPRDRSCSPDQSTKQTWQSANFGLRNSACIPIPQGTMFQHPTMSCWCAAQSAVDPTMSVNNRVTAPCSKRPIVTDVVTRPTAVRLVNYLDHASRTGCPREAFVERQQCGIECLCERNVQAVITTHR